MSANPNPWVVQQSKQAVEAAPVGFHLAEFIGVADVTMKDGAVKWRFAWKVKAGEHAGKEASALCDRNLSPTTLPGVLIAGLLGGPVKPGDNVEAAVKGCIGQTYMVAVQPGPRGGKPGVRTVGPVPAM